MKIKKLLFLLLLVFILTSCTNGNLKENTKATDIDTKPTTDSNVEFRTANIIFKDEQEDLAVIEKLINSFLDDYYKALDKKLEFNGSNYTDSENFQRYIKEKVDYSKHEDLVPRTKVYEINIDGVVWHLENNYVYVDALVKFTNDAEGHQFLIVNERGKLKIVDWLTPGPATTGYLDDLVRATDDKLEDINFWNNENRVEEIFADIEKYK